jgi:hypothetical protein
MLGYISKLNPFDVIKIFEGLKVRPFIIVDLIPFAKTSYPKPAV